MPATLIHGRDNFRFIRNVRSQYRRKVSPRFKLIYRRHNAIHLRFCSSFAFVFGLLDRECVIGVSNSIIDNINLLSL